MKTPRILINIDNGIIWSACCDIEIVLIEENIDAEMIRKVPVQVASDNERINEIEELADMVNINRMEAIKKCKAKKSK